jgi:predicted transcriptional regulator YdeE
VDYEFRQQPPFTMLGVTGGLEEIGTLWDRVGKHFADGSLVSSDPEVMATAAEFLRDGSVVYAAGAPSLDGSAALEGFEHIAVPGGRYALVHHYGPYSDLAEIARGLHTALEAAGESPTAHWLEIYRPLSEDGSTHVEIGVLLAYG